MTARQYLPAMTRPTAPRPAGPPTVAPQQAAPRRAAKHRDFKPALARALPRAVPSPTPPPSPALRPAVARAPAPAPLPVVASPGPLRTPSLRPWEAQANAAFRQRIAEAERSAEHVRDGYGQRNERSGALGRYQFLPIALRDIGWMDADGRWTAAAAAQGVTDEASFLANEHAQEAAMSDFLARQEVILHRLGALGAAGTTIPGLDGQPIALTEGALVAAAHRRGAGMLQRYLRHRMETPDAPLPPALRTAFASIEHRLRGFAEVAYTSERPGNRMMARRGATAG